ncbi:MAG TPA: hypothetical protein GXZ28_07180 [Clostridiales bacterium]|jgi:hypothetical protein|nr:hypothetical protein [Clostridiales bacterium]
MNSKMRNHIEALFEKAPKTRKAFELKEELLANSEERYQDLISNGVTPEDAYKNVISSIGNVSELFQDLSDTEPAINLGVHQKKVAIIKTISIGLYILGVVVFFSFALLGDILHTNIDFSLLGLILMLFIDIIPTCLLVYIANISPKYSKAEDTIVEEFKEWKSDSMKLKSVKQATYSVLWTLTVFLYFLISFITFAWYATWMIFLIAICAQAIIELCFRMKELK